jgi:hypothetical protein
MNHRPTSVSYELFSNGDPETVWRKASALIERTSPGFNFSITQAVFGDIVRLYRGEYPGYHPIKTPYHDLSHIMDVFLCSVRLMHGMAVSGIPFSNREIALVMTATLLHDVGYAQLDDGKETGTGAQYTQNHVARGIEFMRQYLARYDLSSDFAADLEPMIYCTEPMLPVSRIQFPDERIRLLGQIVGTADLVGQMADRKYLEKLSSLYEEFAEGHIGNYQSMYDLICKTHEFYTIIKNKLDREFGGIYDKLVFHFRETLGVPNNYYMESIDKNMAYLKKIASAGESNYRSLLRRGGIVQKDSEPSEQLSSGPAFRQ